MSGSAEVRASDRISEDVSDVNDQRPATPSWEPYVTALSAILIVAVTAGWNAFLVWGAIWLIRR
jgi:hypothetical protein